MAAKVGPDPLGPVNKIVTLMRGNYRVKSVLCPVPAGATVTVGRGGSSYHEMWSGPGWRALNGELEERKPPHWYIEVDGRRVLEVPEHETRPPIPPPPRVPWHRRARTALKAALTAQLRADLNAIAKRLGYHHEDDCGGWDE